MICPHCHREIPDESTLCPECDESIEDINAGRQPQHGEITHYRIVLLNPGPRKNTVDILVEVTGLSGKQVEGYLKELPWIIVSHIPLKQAQEIKVLLETNKAVVRLEGVDIWTNETPEEEADGGAVPHRSRRHVRRQVLILSAFLLVIAAGAAFFVQKLDIFRKQDAEGFGGESGGISEEPQQKRQAPGMPGAAGGAAAEAESRAAGDNPFHVRDEGPNPFKPELAVRFELTGETPITVTVYDKSMKPVTVLLEGNLSPEHYRLIWGGATDANTPVQPGLYFIRITTPARSCLHKIVWLYR